MRQAQDQLSRREWFRYTGVFAGGAMVARAAGADAWAQAQTAADPLDERRAQMGAAPIVTNRLGANLVMLSGPGGNVAALHGPDGVVIVDTFVKPAWAALKQTLDGLGGAPLKLAIDTHWHFDHADNNDRVREAGAATLAHDNTRTRLTRVARSAGDEVPAGVARVACRRRPSRTATPSTPTARRCTSFT